VGSNFKRTCRRSKKWQIVFSHICPISLRYFTVDSDDIPEMETQ